MSQVALKLAEQEVTDRTNNIIKEKRKIRKELSTAYKVKMKYAKTMLRLEKLNYKMDAKIDEIDSKIHKVMHEKLYLDVKEAMIAREKSQAIKTKQALETSKKATESDLEKMKSRVEDSKIRDIETLEKNKKRLEQNIEKKDKTVNKLDGKNEKLDRRLRNINLNIEYLQNKKNLLQNHVTNNMVEFRLLSEKQNSNSTNIERLQRVFDNLEKQRSDAEKSLADFYNRKMLYIRGKIS